MLIVSSGFWEFRLPNDECLIVHIQTSIVMQLPYFGVAWALQGA